MLVRDEPCHAASDGRLALDWGTIGRAVRRRTLDAVSAHFTAMAAAEGQAEVEPANTKAPTPCGATGKTPSEQR